MYGKPFKKTAQSLGKTLGFKDWAKGVRPESKRISLAKKTRECPLCHSKQILNVLVGYPEVMDLEKYHLYGCCIRDGFPSTDWYCNHCGLPIWR